MPKQLNVNMSFTADTSQAKRQLQDLQKQLTELGKGSKLDNQIIDPKQFQEAATAVAKLKVQLEEATNQKTGTLDLSKFKEQLDQGGTSLAQYRDQLSKLGPAGQKAFSSLTDSILMAEVPLKRTNALLDQFWTALKNTARWQISSSALHGFIGALSGAYGYAQNLDKSLNSIRIVTGQSTDQMAALATQANKTAQALSTSTLAYTDAALIFYQQGLDDAQVAERVEATLKLSNVTGESAEDISSYMTAIWNNFAEAGDSLELYIDKITALGAATASSSREIASGLQQFAAVADTVGLSYDYAATALATVVAQTRQSESTVGNAFRTIFSRLEGLKLGETLEDGTDLNKYSGTLQTIGVNIKDQNGELRQMDDILEDIGSKWQSLSRDQQMALAQTVGGVRQYANLIALFDNWDEFQKNLKVTQGAEGTLDEQAKIYAESWEAAKKRVKAAAQEIYQSLIDEDFFITVLNFTGDLLNSINNIIDAFGGLKGILTAVVSTLLQVSGKDIGQGISNALYNLMPASIKREDALKVKKDAVNANIIEKPEDAATQLALTQSENLNNYKNLQLEILHNAEKLTEQDKKHLTILLDQNKALQQSAEERAKAVDKARANTEDKLEALYRTAGQSYEGTQFGSLAKKLKQQQFAANFETDEAQLKQLYTQKALTKDREESLKITSQIIDVETKMGATYDLNTDALGEYSATLRQQVNEELALKQAEDTLRESTAGVSEKIQAAGVVLKPVGENIVEIARSLSSLVAVMNIAKGIWDTIQNPNLSVWEKLSTILPALVMGFSALSRVHLINNLRSAATVIVKAAETAARLRNADAINKEASSLTKLNFKSLKENLSDTTKIFGKSFSKISTFFSDFKKGWELTVNGDLLPAIEGGATEIDSFGTALGSLGPYALVAVVAIAATVATIKALDAAFVTAKERVDQAKKALADASAELERSAKRASQAESAFKSLVDTLNGLDDTRNKIAGMTKDTAEWREAIAESNEQLLSAIDSVGKLGDVDILYDENGLAYLSKAQAEMVKQAAQVEASSNRIAKIRDQINVKEKAQDVSIAENWKKYSDNNLNWMERLSESWIGNGTQFENFSKAAEMLANTQFKTLTADELAKKLNADKIPEELQKIAAFYPDLAQNQEMLDAISKAAQDISGNDTEEQTKLLGQQMLSAAGIDSNSVYGKYMQETLGTANLEATEKELSNIGLDLLKDDTKTWKNLYKEYASFTENVAFKDGFLGIGKGKVVDSTGNVIDDEVIKQAVANYRTQNYSIDSYYKQYPDRNRDSDVADAYNNAMQEQARRIGAIYGTEGGLDFSSENYVKQMDFLVNLSDEEIQKLGGWDALQERLDKLEEEHDIQLNVDADDFTQLKSSVKDEDILQEVQDFADYLQDYADQVDELSNHLKDCRAETEKIAYAIMRFDDAIQDVTENYEDWSDALEAGGQRAASAFKDIAKAYGNVMDIDGSALSSEFLSSTEHLKDMKLAIEGNEEAYNRLLDAAARDDLANNFGQTASEIDNLLGAVSSAMDAAQAALDHPLVAGENINYTPLETALNNVLALVGNNVEAANRLLAELGYDAELEEVTTKKPANTQTVSLDVTADPEVPVTMPTYEGLQGLFGPKTQTEYVSGGFTVTPRKEDTPSESVETVTALKVKPGTVHKAVGGNVKFKQSTHGGGGVSPSKGGSGGGGGGGSKKKTVKEHTKPAKNEDRYHDIKERIDDLTKSLQRLSKTESRVYGKAKLKYMDQEIEKLEKQIELTDDYIDEIKKYAAQDQAALRGIGMGAEFDANGMLTNYEQVLANITASYNGAIDAYNGAVDVFNGSAQEDADNEALDNSKKQLDAAKEVYDENQKILKQYEDTYNLLQEQVDKRIDQVWELFDMRLKKITFEVEFEIEWNERELKYLDWILKNIGDDADKGADKIANLSKQMDEYADTIEWAKKGISGIFGLHGISFDFDNADPVAMTDELTAAMQRLNFESQLTEDEANALLDYCDKLMEAYDGIKEKWQAAHDAVNDTWEKWNENIERGTKKLEQYAKVLDNIKEIADLTGRKMLNLTTADINKMNQAIIENSWAQVEANKAIMDATEASLTQAQRYLDQSTDEMQRAEWQKTVDQLTNDLYAAQDNYYSSWKDTLSKTEKAFSDSMENIAKDYNEAMGNLSLVTEQFNRKTDISHLYLDDYEKYHELNKSADELRKSLENTNNTVMKSKLQDLLDEINQKLNSGVQMSEAQTEIIARRVALLQAESELMDAQNAKSAVRMTRDNEGNFSYTYTADQDLIDGAEQNYADKFYELLKFERDYQEQIQSEMLQKQQEFIDQLNEINETYKDDEEARMAALQDLLDDYAIYEDYFVSELQMDFDEMARLQTDDWKHMETMTGKKLANQDDFIKRFDQTITGQLQQSYKTAENYGNHWLLVMQQTHNQADQAAQTYQQNVQKTYEAAGENITEYGQKSVEKMQDIANQSQETKNEVSDMAWEMQMDMNQIMSTAWQLDNAWIQVMNSMRNQIAQTVSALYQLLQRLQEVQRQAEATIRAAQEAAQAQIAANMGNSLSGGNSNSGGGNGTNNGGGMGQKTPVSWSALFNGITSTYDHKPAGLHGVVNYSDGTTGTFDTGGYTGAWGPEGKMAVLHEKELVLNKEDTLNILSVVDMVRNLANQFGLAGSLSSIANSIMNSSQLAMAGAGTMDQNVHIEASFPNVQSHTEIELALNNLINSASQYVNRK